MADDQYTHDFEFQVGDGGQFIEGEVEFNTDGKVSYRISDFSEPLNKETMQYFDRLNDVLKDIFHHYEGIKKIEVIRSDLK